MSRDQDYAAVLTQTKLKMNDLHDSLLERKYDKAVEVCKDIASDMVLIGNWIGQRKDGSHK